MCHSYIMFSNREDSFVALQQYVHFPSLFIVQSLRQCLNHLVYHFALLSALVWSISGSDFSEGNALSPPGIFHFLDLLHYSKLHPFC